MKLIETTLETFEQDQQEIHLWGLANLGKKYKADRWASEPLKINEKFYIPIDNRVVNCPKCTNFVEIDL